MSVDKSSETVRIWERILNEEPTPAVKKAIEAALAKFDQHREALLHRLRTVSGNSFDEEKSWRHLTHLAQVYFLWQATPPASKRRAGLRRLATDLGGTRDLAEQVRQDNVGRELISLWMDGILPREPGGQIVLGEDGSLRVVYFPEMDLKEMVAKLDAFQTAALRAAKDVPATASGPAPFLPTAFIGALADAYLELTGRKPGAGRGPFARFAVKFRAALDPAYRTITDEKGRERVDDSLIDVIMIALRRWKRGRGLTK